jgi:hypothetical protein
MRQITQQWVARARIREITAADPQFQKDGGGQVEP